MIFPLQFNHHDGRPAAGKLMILPKLGQKLLHHLGLWLMAILLLGSMQLKAQTYTGSLYLSTQAQVNGFNYTEVTGDVQVKGAGITDLSALSILTRIGGFLDISNNPDLTNLAGLESLSYIGGNFFMTSNSVLTTLAGLGTVSFVGGDLFIYNNTRLAQCCELQPIIQATKGGVSISGNAINCNSKAEIRNTCTLSQVCEGDVTLSNQAEVDAFNCSEITGNLTIASASLITDLEPLARLTKVQGNILISSIPVSLAGLRNLTSVGGKLSISYFKGNDLTGLEGLTSIGGALELYTNSNLTNLKGLDNLTSVGEIIITGCCQKIANLKGLEKLTTVKSGISIKNTPEFTSFQGLESLTSIGGGLTVSFNAGLSSLTGLEHVTSIRGDLTINNNAALSSVAGLENLTSVASLDIRNNPSLSECCLLMPVIAATNTVNISNNAPSCNSPQEIGTACAPVISSQPQPVTACAGQMATFSITATGRNLGYQWRKNGVDIAGANDSVYRIASAVAADAGAYSVVVSNYGSSVTSDAAKLTVNALAAPVVTVTDNCGSSTLSTTATGTLLWSTGETTSIISVSTAGSYTVTQSLGGCVSEAGLGTAAPKAGPAKPVIIAVNSCSNSTLSVPTGFASYKWSNGAITPSIVVTQSGHFTVTVTDGNGCASDISDAIKVNINKDVLKPVIILPVVVPFCYVAGDFYTIPQLQATDNCAVASITYNITGATTRNGSGSNASGTFKPGTSTITWTVKDAAGNQSTGQSKVVVNATFSVGLLDAWALGNGGLRNTVYKGYIPGSYILLIANPVGGKAPYTYRWSNGANTKSILVNPQAVTTYSVTVKDAAGCTQTASRQITVVDVRCGAKGDKVSLCYLNKTLCVEQKEVVNYLLRGGYLGACRTVTTTTTMTTPTANTEIREETMPLELTASPNPTTNHFRLQIKGRKDDKIGLIVTDVLGRVIENTRVTPGTLQVGADYRPGIYIVTIVQGNNRSSVKLVKQ